MASSRKLQRASKPRSLAQHLHLFFQYYVTPDQPLVIGLSGGLDSCVLLHLLVELGRELPIKLSALHVNHQISPNADAWQAFCAALCANYGVDFKSVTVDVPRDSGLGMEAAARELRYAALLSEPGDVLLAHHQDDQTETLMLQLLRGAGVDGLAAMPEYRAIGSKRLLRPLLDVARNQLFEYANAHEIDWIEDESNEYLKYDRNYLRHAVFPVIARRFSGYSHTLARAASNLADAAALLEQIALEDAAKALQDGRLDIAWLKAATPERAMNLLRKWVLEVTGLNPGSARLHNMLSQLCQAKPNANVDCELNGYSLRRYRQFAYIVSNIEFIPFSVEWHGESCLHLPNGKQLFFREAIGEGIAKGKLEKPLLITSRKEGGALRVSENGSKRSLKNLWQEAGIPPWEREQAIFVWHGDELVAVLGLGIDRDWKVEGERSGLQLSVHILEMLSPEK